MYITPLASGGSSTITWSDIKSLPKFTETHIEKDVSRDIPKPEGSDDECCRRFLDEPGISFTTTINSPSSSFGPFQLEEEAPAPPVSPAHNLLYPSHSAEGAEKARRHWAAPAGDERLDGKSSKAQALLMQAAPPSQVYIASTDRSNSYPPDGCASVDGLIRRASSGSRGGGARDNKWELSSATLDWFT